MVLKATQTSGKLKAAVFIGQAALSLVAMIGLILAPRDGEPALLYPVTDTGAAALPKVISGPGTLILARGQFSGSYIIGGVRPGFVESMINSGIITLNASAPGCGPVSGPQSTERTS